MHCFHDELPRILDVRVFNVEHAMPRRQRFGKYGRVNEGRAVEKLAIDEGPLADLLIVIYEGQDLPRGYSPW